MQLAWSNQQPAVILSHLLRRTRILPIISLRPVKADFDPTMDEEKSAAMVEATLSIILTTLGVTKLIGTRDSRDQLKKEVVGVLAVAERGHHELTENIPGLVDAHEYDVGNFSLTIADLDQVLSEVAESLPVRRKEQGKYRLTEQGWSLYDPVFSLHRTTCIKDMENAKMNYVAYRQEKERLEGVFLNEPTQNQIYGIPFPPLPSHISREYSRLLSLLDRVDNSAYMSHTLGYFSNRS